MSGVQHTPGPRLSSSQRALLVRLCGPEMICLRGAQIRSGQVLVKLGLALEVDGCTWRLLPTEAGCSAIAKATGGAS